MEPDNWVNNKQTIQVNFYKFTYRNINYKQPFCKSNQKIAKRIYLGGSSPTIATNILCIFYTWFFLLCFWRYFIPYSHVAVSINGSYYEVREGNNFWRDEEFENKKFKLVETVNLECNKIPTEDELFGYTRNLPIHMGTKSPKDMAFAVAFMFLPIRILGYPRITNDCVSVAAHLLSLFGIKVSKYAWTPKSFYDSLLKKENVCKTKWTYSKNSS